MDTQPVRTTIYLDPAIHQALRLKAAATRRPMSEIVPEALKHSLREDHEDLQAFEARNAEKAVSYDDFRKALAANGDR